MLDYFIFGLSAASFILVILSLIFINKKKLYEHPKLEPGINALLFGLFFLALFLLIKALEYANLLFHEIFLKITPGITTYLNYLTSISDLAFVPLTAVCFFVAMLMFKRLF